MAHTPDLADLARAERTARKDMDAANYANNDADRADAERRLQSVRQALIAAARIGMSADSLLCLALVKPDSDLAREWKLDKPAYCIYEYSRAFGTREIRWGDGSSQALDEVDQNDLILLPQFGQQEISALFDF